MSNKELLYKALKINPRYRDVRVTNGKVFSFKDPKNRHIKLVYPEFNENKQLAVLKWICSEYSAVEMDWFSDTGFIFKCNKYQEKNKDFLEALCGLILQIKTDLRETELKELKSLLNSNRIKE